MKASARFNGVNLQDAKLPWKDLYRRGKIAQQKFEAFYRCAIASNRCAKIFLRERTIKRGGLYKFMSLDAEAAESRYQHEPAADLALTPEQIFDARWALTLLNEAMKTVQVQYDRSLARSAWDSATQKSRITGIEPGGCHMEDKF